MKPTSWIPDPDTLALLDRLAEIWDVDRSDVLNTAPTIARRHLDAWRDLAQARRKQKYTRRRLQTPNT